MYSGHISNLVGKLVRVNRGGPESSEGILLAVKNDYIVIFVKHEGVVYYKRDHIKSITQLDRPHKPHIRKEHSPKLLWKLKKYSSFLDALRSKKGRLIKINRGGPESIIGVLNQVNRDYITLIDNKETIFIFTEHIKSFTPSLRLINQYKGKHNQEEKHDHKHDHDKKKDTNKSAAFKVARRKH